MNDSSSAVTTFSGEVQGEPFLAAAELRPEVHQLFDAPGPIADDHLDDFTVGQPTARADGIVDVGLERVGWVEHRGDAALGPVGRGVRAAPLRDHHYTAVTCRFEREAQPSHSATQHQVVTFRSHGQRSLHRELEIAHAVAPQGVHNTLSEIVAGNQ